MTCESGFKFKNPANRKLYPSSFSNTQIKTLNDEFKLSGLDKEEASSGYVHFPSHSMSSFNSAITPTLVLKPIPIRGKKSNVATPSDLFKNSTSFTNDANNLNFAACEPYSPFSSNTEIKTKTVSDAFLPRKPCTEKDGSSNDYKPFLSSQTLNEIESSFKESLIPPRNATISDEIIPKNLSRLTLPEAMPYLCVFNYDSKTNCHLCFRPVGKKHVECPADKKHVFCLICCKDYLSKNPEYPFCPSGSKCVFIMTKIPWIICDEDKKLIQKS